MTDIIRKILYNEWDLLYIYNDEEYDNVTTVKKCLIEMIKKEDTYVDDDTVIEDMLIKVFVKDKKNIITNVIMKALNKLYTLKQQHHHHHGDDNDNNDDSIITFNNIQLSTTHPGLGQVYKYIDTNDYFIISSQYSKHSLLSIIRFHANTLFMTPTLGRYCRLGSKDIRIRFLIFQLLQVLSYLHDNDVVANLSNPGKIMIDDSMWLHLPVSNSNAYILSQLLYMKEKYHDHKDDDVGPILEEDKDVTYNEEVLEADIDNVINDLTTTTPIHRHIDYDCTITSQWMSRKISNFEYLMIINYAAGRSMLDPLYHPIFPWLTDFTSDCLKYDDVKLSTNIFRDLSKTKFRLSKGDAQLETTFRHSDPPHHVPESLSELTYYIYLARRTPLQVLRRVVRDVFVPEHYPHSIARMYDWTPDECIPEFYFDLTVFESLHKDLGLPDLELPSFAPTPAEFISYHRAVLESDEVSSQIHLWIDLTFGHLLIGEEAEINLNVPLKQTLASNSQLSDTISTKHPGFCILFHEPHPRRQVMHKPYSNSNFFPLSQDKLDIGFGANKRNFFSNELGAFLQLDRHESRERLPSSNNASPSDRPHQQLTEIESSILVSETSFANEASPIESYLTDMNDNKFALKYRHLLEPYYGRGISDQDSFTPIAEDQYKDYGNKMWDEEFQKTFLSYLALENSEAVPSASSSASSSSSAAASAALNSLQREDMFALGCIIAEMVTGEPLMSPDIARRNMSDRSGRSSLLHTYQMTASVPLVFRR